MASVNFKWDDRELRELLKNAKNKKVYRQLANDVLEDLKRDVEYATHVDTGLMQRSWEVTPLKMRDGGYSVMGTLTNDASLPKKEPYPSYELARGGSHDAIAQGMQLLEMELGDTLEDVLEGLLK